MWACSGVEDRGEKVVYGRAPSPDHVPVFIDLGRGVSQRITPDPPCEEEYFLWEELTG